MTRKPPSSFDAVIEVYKRDIDRTLLRENLKLTPTERILKLQSALKLAEEFRRAGKQSRNH